MPLNPDLVGKLYDTMDPQLKNSAKAFSREKTPSSFVNGKWLHPEPLKKEPWIHEETKAAEKPFWHNYEAMGQWSNLSAEARRDALNKAAAVFKSKGSEITDIETSLHGSPADLLTKEVLPFLHSYWTYYGGWAALDDPQNRQFYAAGNVAIDVRRSKFPLLEACLAIAPALAAGCVVTVVCQKRAESLLFFASNANLPAGVLNVVVTAGDDPLDGDLGRTSAIFGPIRPTKSHPFGNWENNFSGRSCVIVLNHADFEGAAHCLVESVTKRANFTMWPVAEVLVQEHLFEPFVKYFEKLLPNVPTKWPETRIAPVRKFAKDEGLKLLESGEAVVLVNGRMEEAATSSMVESGPFAVGLLPVRSLAEALGVVNSRPRTLSASVWSQDGPLATQAVNGIKVPLVWTNQHGVFPSPSIGLGSTLYAGNGLLGGSAGLLNFKQWRPTVCDKGAHRHVTKWSEEGGSSLPTLNMLIDGRLVAAASSKVLVGRTEKPVANVNMPNSKEVSTAVASCLKAFGAWSAQTQAARAEALLKLGLALTRSESEYAQLLKEYGTEGAAAHELQEASKHVNKWAATAITNQVLQHRSDGRSSSRQVPLGVVAIAGPIDGLGPLLGLLAPALVAGNCVVVSASPREPLAALHLAQVASALPPGVVTVIGPGAESHLAAHGDIAALWIGLRNVLQLTSDAPKRLWRVDYAALGTCPDEYFIHQATNFKTVITAE